MHACMLKQIFLTMIPSSHAEMEGFLTTFYSAMLKCTFLTTQAHSSHTETDFSTSHSCKNQFFLYTSLPCLNWSSSYSVLFVCQPCARSDGAAQEEQGKLIGREEEEEEQELKKSFPKHIYCLFNRLCFLATCK
jgi:hypothetical protein